MAARVQDLPGSGQLCTLGQICIIESLPPGEIRTGAHLYEALRDLTMAGELTIDVNYRAPSSSGDLLVALEHIRADVAARGRNPLVHLDCHGAQDLTGLILADGSHLPWRRLSPSFAQINLLCRFNLFLTFACCFGGYFLETGRTDEPAAYSGFIGPPHAVNAGDLQDGFIEFYRSLAVRGDVTAALDAMLARVSRFPYYNITAEGYFRKVYSTFLRERGTNDALRAWAARRGMQLQDIEALKLILQEEVRRDFDRSRPIYFALDRFPENVARVTVTFEDVLADAARPHRR